MSSAWKCNLKEKQRPSVETSWPPWVCPWCWTRKSQRWPKTLVSKSVFAVTDKSLLQFKLRVCLSWLLLLNQATPNIVFLKLCSWNPETEELDIPVQITKKGLGFSLYSYLTSWNNLAFMFFWSFYLDNGPSCVLIPNLVTDFLSIFVFHLSNYFLNIQCVLISLSLLSSLHHVIKPKSLKSSPHPRAGHLVPIKYNQPLRWEEVIQKRSLIFNTIQGQGMDKGLWGCLVYCTLRGYLESNLLKHFLKKNLSRTNSSKTSSWMRALPPWSQKSSFGNKVNIFACFSRKTSIDPHSKENGESRWLLSIKWGSFFKNKMKQTKPRFPPCKLLFLLATIFTGAINETNRF